MNGRGSRNQLIYKQTIVLLIGAYFLALIFKIFGLKYLVIPDIDFNVNLIIERLINSTLYLINGYLIVLLIVKQKIPLFKFIILLSGLLILYYLSIVFVDLNLVVLKMVFEILYTILIVKFLFKLKLKNIIFETFIISIITMLLQIVMLLTRELSLFTNQVNFIGTLIYCIDYYIGFILLNIIFYGKEVFINDIIMGCGKSFIFLLTKRRCKNERIQENEKTIFKSEVKEEKEIGYKIYLVLLSLFQFITVYLCCSLTTVSDTILLQFIIIFLAFSGFRTIFGKSYHANSIIKCTAISSLVFIIANRVALPSYISLTFHIALGLIIAYIMYVIAVAKEYEDIKKKVKKIKLQRGMTLDSLQEYIKIIELSERELSILKMYYVERRSIKYISNTMNYSYFYIVELKKNIELRIKAASN